MRGGEESICTVRVSSLTREAAYNGSRVLGVLVVGGCGRRGTEGGGRRESCDGWQKGAQYESAVGVIILEHNSGTNGNIGLICKRVYLSITDELRREIKAEMGVTLDTLCGRCMNRRVSTDRRWLV